MTTTPKFGVAGGGLLGGLLAVPRAQPPLPATEDPLGALVQRYLWSTSESDRRAAETALSADASLTAMSRERFHDLEEAMRRGRPSYPPVPARVSGGQGPPGDLVGRFPIVELQIDVPAGPPGPGAGPPAGPDPRRPQL